MKKIGLLVLSLVMLHVTYAQKSAVNNSYGIDWILPKAVSSPVVGSFEKLEIGVSLPDSIAMMVSSFIKDSLIANKLNPFNPEDIDIKAEFFFKVGNNWTPKNFVYAFYYEDFKRNTSAKNPKDWNWSQLKTKDNFRIRFTPNQVGKWKFVLSVKVKNGNSFKVGEYEFSCGKSESPAFVTVSESKRFLKCGENVFIPVGQNMPKPICYYYKDSLGKVIDEYKCANCDCAGYEEWCPGMKTYPMNPNGYMTFIKEIEKLRNAGANYYRVMLYPHTYEFEYEKLGNYTKRQNSAWELDQLVEKSQQIGIKLNLNIFAGYAAAVNPYGVKGWDWIKENDQDYGYCYRSELGLNETIDFLTNPEALKHYKNRLRYLVSRWGYSTAIAQFEMMNEINNKFQAYPKEMYRWHYEITKYIKEDLGHTNQLLTVNYDGLTPQENLGDSSFSIPYVDVITHNFHRISISRKDVQQAYDKFSYHNKPLIFSEIGTGDSGLEVCDKQTEWQKDLWLTLFSGTASAGVNWNEQHNYAIWECFKNLQAYVKDINFEEYVTRGNVMRKDKLVELLFMKNESNSKSIGAIHNLTWNYFTNSSDGKQCRIENKPSNELYQTFQAVEAKKKKKGFTLLEMKSKTTFVVEWFDPMTGKIMQTDEAISGGNGKLSLIHPNLDWKMPFVCYRIYPKGEVFSTITNNVNQIKATKKTNETKVYTE